MAILKIQKHVLADPNNLAAANKIVDIFEDITGTFIKPEVTNFKFFKIYGKDVPNDDSIVEMNFQLKNGQVIAYLTKEKL